MSVWRARLYTGQSISSSSVKTANNKILMSSAFNDSEGLYKTTVCRCLVRGTHAFRDTLSERVRHRNGLTEIAWEDAVQGLGLAMSTVASEKNREMLFIGNVFYKQ